MHLGLQQSPHSSPLNRCYISKFRSPAREELSNKLATPFYWIYILTELLPLFYISLHCCLRCLTLDIMSSVLKWQTLCVAPMKNLKQGSFPLWYNFPGFEWKGQWQGCSVSLNSDFMSQGRNRASESVGVITTWRLHSVPIPVAFNVAYDRRGTCTGLSVGKMLCIISSYINYHCSFLAPSYVCLVHLSHWVIEIGTATFLVPVNSVSVKVQAFFAYLWSTSILHESQI